MAILGADFPGLRIRVQVEEGDLVDAGQTLFHDRKTPEIAFVAPTRGRVLSIRYAAKRMFSSLVLTCLEPTSGDQKDPRVDVRAPDVPNRETLVAALTQNGFWPSFVTRPFGGMPDPQSLPDAIFVTATPSSKSAPDPRAVLDGKLDAFSRALDALALMTEGKLFLCQDTGDDLLRADSAKVRIEKFQAKPGMGLPGTHVHRLHPVGAGRTVWTINYQDVLAIGHFLLTGQRDFTRLVAVHGPLASKPQMVRVIQGAKLTDITPSDFADMLGPSRTFSGGLEQGREAAFLGRHHDEVTLTQMPVLTRPRHVQPIIPHRRIDHALTMNLLAVPLMRALSVGDIETAQRLGCLELLEEDVAVLTARCTSGTDYGQALRGALDALKEAA